MAPRTSPCARSARSSAECTGTVESLRPHLLDEQELSRFGDPHRLLFNVNDPKDLREAEALITG